MMPGWPHPTAEDAALLGTLADLLGFQWATNPVHPLPDTPLPYHSFFPVNATLHPRPEPVEPRHVYLPGSGYALPPYHLSYDALLTGLPALDRMPPVLPGRWPAPLRLALDVSSGDEVYAELSAHSDHTFWGYGADPWDMYLRLLTLPPRTLAYAAAAVLGRHAHTPRYAQLLAATGTPEYAALARSY